MYVVSWLGINIHNISLCTKFINIASKFCYCSNKNNKAKPQTQGEKNQNSRKKPKTQGKNSSSRSMDPRPSSKLMLKKCLPYSVLVCPEVPKARHER